MSSRSVQIVGGPSREHAWVDGPTNALLVKVVNPGGGGSGGDVNLASYGGVAVGAGNALHVQPGTGAVFQVGDNGSSLTVDGTVNVGNFPATVAVTQSTSPWLVNWDGSLSAGNSTTTPLGSGATFTGAFEEVTDHAMVTVTVFANVASATDGMKLQWSGDGTNVDREEGITIAAGATGGRALALNVRGRYFRVVYTNGGTAQATFRLGTVYHPVGTGLNNVVLDQTIPGTALAILTRSVITGETTAGGGAFVNVKVSPSGAVETNANQGTSPWVVSGMVAVSNFPATVAVTQSTSPWVVSGTVTANQGGSWTVGVVNLTHAFLLGQMKVEDANGSGSGPFLRVSEQGGTYSAADSGAMLSAPWSSLPKWSELTSVNTPLNVMRSDLGGNLLVSGWIRGRADTAERVLDILPEGQTYGAGPFASGISGAVIAAPCVADPTTVTRTTNDFGSLRLDNNQRLWTTIQTVAPGTGATHLGKAEDAVHASGDVGVMALAVRNDAQTAVAASGDYIPLAVSSTGALWIAQSVHDRLNATVRLQDGDSGALLDVVRTTDSVAGNEFGTVPMFNVVSGVSISDGTWSQGFLDRNTGGLYIHLVGSDIQLPVDTGLAQLEDNPHSTGQTGVMSLAVRRDTLVSTTSANNDYATLNVDSVGALWTRIAGVTTIALSGSTRGRPIQITGTATGSSVTLHTATTTSGQLDKVYIDLTNTSDAAVVVTIEFGTTGTGNELHLTIPARETVPAVVGMVLGGAATDTIKAFAATANVINAVGRVERLG